MDREYEKRQREQLRTLEERIYRYVAPIRARMLAVAEVDRLHRLRESVGEWWDAANQRWIAR